VACCLSELCCSGSWQCRCRSTKGAWPAVYLNSAAQVPGNVGAGVQKGRGWAWPADQPGGAEPAVLPGAARVMAPLAPGQDEGSPLHTQEVSQICLKRKSLTFLFTFYRNLYLCFTMHKYSSGQKYIRENT
jgi:hypothetical protein